MRKMRKVFLMLFLSGILVSPFFSLAKSPASDCETYCSDTNSYDPPTGKSCICNPVKAKTFEELIKAIIVFLIKLALVATALVIVLSGFYFVTAAGDPAKVTKAKQMIFYALIGLAIVLAAEGIVVLIEKVIKGK